ncbi:MAG: hypothetical protein ABSE87_02890 [Terracidiphilus sp.]|jgi:hypothetical protein
MSSSDRPGEVSLAGGPNSTSGNQGLSPHLQGSLDEKIASLKDQISERARGLALERAKSQTGAKKQQGPAVDVSDLSQAIDEALCGDAAPARKPTFFDLFSPFTCLCFLLCVTFGGLGLFARTGSGAPSGGAAPTQGFLDIAKIFAGALAGSTVSAPLKALKPKRGKG